MELTLKEYIKEYYPIKEKVERIKENPIQKIMQQDDLPFDAIAVIDGELQKVVYTSDDECITVLELLSYTKEDIDKLPESEFKEIWYTYMDNVEVSPMDLESLISVSKEYRESLERKKELLKDVSAGCLQ